MKLLFLACLSPNTGNNTTAERIRSYIEAAGHTCELRDAAEFQSPAEVADLVSQYPPFDGALAIHLFKAGRLLLDIHVPFGVIFGGTDINEDVKVKQKCVVMEQVLLKARFAVAFTNKMKEQAELSLLSQSSKIYVQPQGIQTKVAEKFCWIEFLRSSANILEAKQSSYVIEDRCFILCLGDMNPPKSLTSALASRGYLIMKASVSCEHMDELRVFLLVCGLRRVKDPLYLVKVFSEWHYENPQNVLVIIGPKIDPAFTVEVEAVVKRTAGVFLAQERSQQELHAAMKRCFATVNSSVSEGMSAAILEAMDLEVPVLARDIPGNSTVVQHEFNGLLFSSPQEFVLQSQRLLSDSELREKVVCNGKLYVEEHHSIKRERETYQRLVDTLL